jgi:hypothetical protein
MVACAIWFAGLATVIGIAALRYALFVGRMRCAAPAPADWSAEWQQMCRDRSVQSSIPLVTARDIGPALCRLPSGPRLVVPESAWPALSSAERLAILRHELEHFRRGDLWRLLVVRLLASVHWFNPLAWWTARQYEAQSEYACDAAAAGDDPTAFSQLLVQLAAGHSRRAAGVQAVAAGCVYERVRRLLNGEAQCRGWRAGLPAVVAAIAFLAASVRLEAVAPVPATRSESEPTPVADGGRKPDDAPASIVSVAPEVRTNSRTDAARSSQTDAAGDPLPVGALLRLGTARLRQTVLLEGLAFTPDSSRSCRRGGTTRSGSGTLKPGPSSAS